MSQIGHNSAAEAEAQRAEITARIAAFAQGADVWAARPTLNDETAPRARDFIAGLKQLGKEADESRKLEKAPYLERGREIDAAWGRLTDQIATLLVDVERKLTAYLREQKRRQEEAAAEARRQAEDARMAAALAEAERARAQAPSAQVEAQVRAEEARVRAETAERQAEARPVRVDSATGLARRAGLRTVYRVEVQDIRRAMLRYADHSEMRALIERLAGAEVRAAPTVRGEKQIPTIPGCAIVTSEELAA